jgi:hypothetical protein
MMRIPQKLLLCGVILFTACDQPPVEVEDVPEPGAFAQGDVQAFMYATESDLPLEEQLGTLGKTSLSAPTYSSSANYEIASVGFMDLSGLEVRVNGQQPLETSYVSQTLNTISYGPSASSTVTQQASTAFADLFAGARNELEVAYLNGFDLGYLSKNSDRSL